MATIQDIRDALDELQNQIEKMEDMKNDGYEFRNEYDVDFVLKRPLGDITFLTESIKRSILGAKKND